MKVLIAILLVVLLSLHARLWLGQGEVPAMRELEQAAERQRRENGVLAERNRSLQAEVDDLRSGLEAVEERARSEMGMIREGEIFFRTLEPRRPPGGAGGERE